MRVDAFTVVATVAAVVAGAIASISGFGIGSVLTPVLSTQFDVRLAIAMVSLPHLAGTFIRFLLVRTRIDRDVLLGFGAASAIGGLAGAALQTIVQSLALARHLRSVARIRRDREPHRVRAADALLWAAFGAHRRRAPGTARWSRRKSGRDPGCRASRFRRPEGSLRRDGDRGGAHRRRCAHTNLSGHAGSRPRGT